MRIVLATPLYPPDIAWPAPYIKELAGRLQDKHEITVVTYGELPERVEGVGITAVSKRRPLLLRLFAYTKALWRAATAADLIYAENGASVELPLIVVSLISRVPIVVHRGDRRAHERARQNRWLAALEDTAASRAKKVLEDSPDPRPEILPFVPYPTNEFAAYEASWHKHLEALADLFIYARQ